MAREHEYDIIISDGNMSGTSGLMAARTLRGFGITTPVAMISGLSRIEREAIMNGITEIYENQ